MKWKCISSALLEVTDPSNRALGLPRLKERIHELADRPLPELCAGILAMVRSHGVQSDDQSLLLARIV